MKYFKNRLNIQSCEINQKQPYNFVSAFLSNFSVQRRKPWCLDC